MFSIEQQFNIKDVENDFKEFADNAEQELIAAMKSTGKLIVERARANASFNNITFNLRSSIGYVISNPDGNVIDVYFPTVGKGSEGSQKGEAYGCEVAAMLNDGDYLLIIISGMEYSALVEARVDVISGSLGSLQKEIEALLI